MTPIARQNTTELDSVVVADTDGVPTATGQGREHCKGAPQGETSLKVDPPKGGGEAARRPIGR